MKTILRGNPSLPLHQRGMATILIVMLVGMALTVTALGVMYSLRTSQEQQVTVHAASHAQAGVHAAAKAVRLYLESEDLNISDTFNNENTLVFKINENDVAVKTFPLEPIVDGNSFQHRLRTEISYTDIAAKSTSMLGVVYDITPAGSRGDNDNKNDGNGPPAIYIKKNLNLTDKAKIKVDENTILNVSGVLNFGKSKIEKIGTIRTDQSISIAQKIQIGELFSDENITLTGSDVKVLGSANAGGAMTITGGTVGGSANAGGAMAITNGAVGSASAGGAMTITNGTVDSSANAGGAMAITGGTVDSSANAGGAMAITNGKIGDSANAGGAITITNGTVGGSANADGAMTITNGKINGSANAAAAMTITDGTVSGNVRASAAMTIKRGAVGGSASAGAGMTITSGTISGTASAGAGMTITDGAVNNANAVGAMTITNGTVNNANAVGAMTITAATVNNANAGGAMTITGGRVRSKNQNLPVQPVKPDQPIAASAPIIVPVPKLDLTPPKINAYSLKDKANYVFTRTRGKTMVNVRNINSISDGDYYLDESGNICTALDDEECTKSNILASICQSKECKIEFESGNWEIEGDDDDKNPVFTPGILWFEGNLELEDGVFHNSFIASGSITTDEVKVYAVNYSGYAKTCKSTVFYPTNLCGKNALISNSLANTALLAGSYKEGKEANFVGGTIKLEDNTRVFGSVIAGDTIIFDGEVNIKGYISTAGQGTGAAQSWGGDVTIDVTNLPDNIYTGETTNMDGDGNATSGEDGTGNAGSGEREVKILWSRYL